MTLADRKVREFLGTRAVIGWDNIEETAKYAGTSTRHQTGAPAKNINTCSGHRNVQMFVCSSDGRVLVCVPGYWQPEDLIAQFELADRLNTIYMDPKRSMVEKNEAFMAEHMRMVTEASRELRQGSQLQGFDVHKEVHKKGSPFHREAGAQKHKLKTVDQVVHERMAGLPFMQLEKFPTGTFVDFGQTDYRYHLGDNTVSADKRLGKRR